MTLSAAGAGAAGAAGAAVGAIVGLLVFAAGFGSIVLKRIIIILSVR
ncbi:hypothetical protein BOSE127_170473 [Bosea sp. 127]|nr:hypothetical protein BOSE127_170473 [Bosea sp. 127]